MEERTINLVCTHTIETTLQFVVFRADCINYFSLPTSDCSRLQLRDSDAIRQRASLGGDANERRGHSSLGLFRNNAPPDKSAPVQRTSVIRNGLHKVARYITLVVSSFPPHAPPAIHAAAMTHSPTPRLSPTSSIESTDSLVTPNYSDTSTFVDCVVSEDVPGGHFLLFKNSSEVWEEFKDAGYDPFEIQITDAGIPISPSSSLLSGIDLLGDTSPPPLPEVTAVLTRPGSHQVTVPHRASLFDFPSPPILVPNLRTRTEEFNPISVSHPSLGASHDCLAQPTHHPRSSALHRWSTLPSAVYHPDKRRGSIELVTSKATGTFLTRAAKGAITCTDVPVAPVRSLPFVAIPSLSPRPAGYDVPSPARRSRQEASDTFTSFIDMSANKPTLSTSRVHKLFSKIAGGLKSRSKRH